MLLIPALDIKAGEVCKMKFPAFSGKLIMIFCLVVFMLGIFHAAAANAEVVTLPKVNVEWAKTKSPGEVSQTLQIIILLTILSLAPAILMMTTSFVRIVIVLSFLRSALGTQQIPPTQVIVSFALFLTFLTMTPTFNIINQNAIQPYMAGELEFKAALIEAEKPMRAFMIRQTREKDMELFVYASQIARPKNVDDIPTLIIIPSFVLSELKTAFAMGFALFVTFVVIDMVVASILMSMGMFMLPPMMISLPIKIMLFVMVDGWYLVVRSILFSFR